MLKILFSAILFLGLIGCTRTPDNGSIDRAAADGHIVGGEKVLKTHRLAHQVLLLKNQFGTPGEGTETYTLSCTTSAIGRRLLITAAHCVHTDANQVFVEIPAADGKRMRIPIIQSLIHPLYTSGVNEGGYDYLDYDLALLVTDFSLSEDIEVLKLPLAHKDLDLKTITAAGFGRRDGHRVTGAQSAGGLYQAVLSVIEYDTFSPNFKVDQTQGSGACKGDSGGPGIIVRDSETYVVGVFSNMSYKNDSENPDQDICSSRGVYVNVQNHLDWIHSATKRLSRY